MEVLEAKDLGKGPSKRSVLLLPTQGITAATERLCNVDAAYENYYNLGR